MKVAIDISKLHQLSQGRGIGFYTTHLFNALTKYTDIDVKLVEKETNERFDLIHYPYFDFFRTTLPLRKKAPTVVTIHDVTPLIFPQYYPPGIKGKLKFARQKLALRNVKAVITDSNCSKNDIEKYLNIDKSKIYVTHLAPAEHFKVISDQEVLNKVKDKHNLPESFILYVGSVNWNKNLLGIAEAAVSAGMDLVLVGKGFTEKDNLNHPEMRSFKIFMEKYSGNKLFHVVNFVTDEELVIIYNLAEIFLFPSFYEGFGLPVLEAQACGTAVIASNTGSLPEILGSSALMVNPNNVGQIANTINRVLKNENLKKAIIENGLKNVKRFSWEKTAKQTALVYAKILD